MKISELKTPCYVIDAYLPEEMDELVKICDHIVFNSVSQFLIHKEKIKKAAAGIST